MCHLGPSVPRTLSSAGSCAGCRDNATSIADQLAVVAAATYNKTQESRLLLAGPGVLAKAVCYGASYRMASITRLDQQVLAIGAGPVARASSMVRDWGSEAPSCQRTENSTHASGRGVSSRASPPREASAAWQRASALACHPPWHRARSGWCPGASGPLPPSRTKRPLCVARLAGASVVASAVASAVASVMASVARLSLGSHPTRMPPGEASHGPSHPLEYEPCNGQGHGRDRDGCDAATCRQEQHQTLGALRGSASGSCL